MFATMTFRPCLCCTTINTCGIKINFSRTTRLPDVPSFLFLVFPLLKDIIKVVVIVFRTQLQENNVKNATICQQSVTLDFFVIVTAHALCAKAIVHFRLDTRSHVMVISCMVFSTGRAIVRIHSSEALNVTLRK